jgi:hypothetical protein
MALRVRFLNALSFKAPAGMVILCLQVPKDVFPNYQYMTLRMEPGIGIDRIIIANQPCSFAYAPR